MRACSSTLDLPTRMGDLGLRKNSEIEEVGRRRPLKPTALGHQHRKLERGRALSDNPFLPIRVVSFAGFDENA